MKNIFILFLIIGFVFNANSQIAALKTEADTKNLSKKVTELFSNYKIAEATAALKPYWPLPENEFDNFEEKTIKHLNVVKERFGEPLGTLKIKEERIADIALRETYFVRYKYIAIKLVFLYYKNDDGWIVNSFEWNDSFETEFKEQP